MFSFSYLVLVIFSAQVIFARVLTWKCQSELDCHEGYSCHENICKKCLKCDVLFRKGNSCITDFTDCGGCLPGYEEVLITDYSTAIKPCKLFKKVKSKKCTSNSTCPQNYYCSEEYCVKCFDCSLVNRLAPNENCARSLNECGSCLSGFYEIAVTTNSNFKPCERGGFGIQEMPDSFDSFEMAFGDILPIFTLVTVFFCVVFVVLFRRLRGNKTTYQPPIYPSAPPLYTMDAPRNIKKVKETESIVNIVKEEKQQAIAFNPPHASYYSFKETREFRDSTDNDDDNSGSNSCSTATRDQVGEENCSGVLVRRNQQLEVDRPFSASDLNQELESESFRLETVRENVSIELEVTDANEIADDRHDIVDTLSD